MERPLFTVCGVFICERAAGYELSLILLWLLIPIILEELFSMWWLANKEVGHLIPQPPGRGSNAQFRVAPVWERSFQANFENKTALCSVVCGARRVMQRFFPRLTHKRPAWRSQSHDKETVYDQQSDSRCCWTDSCWCSSPEFKEMLRTNRKWEGHLLILVDRLWKSWLRTILKFLSGERLLYIRSSGFAAVCQSSRWHSNRT